MTDESAIAKRYELIAWMLNERQKRIFLAAEAQLLGYGGVSAVSRATGVTRPVIHAGLKNLANRECTAEAEMQRIRKLGGGRKKAVTQDKTLLFDLEKLVEPTTRGDPESPLRCTCKSTRTLAEELKRQGHATSHRMVAALLHELDYSLQGNMKTLEGAQHEDRDKQFAYISMEVSKRLAQGDPVISVDTKKKELIGEFRNNGRTCRPQGTPEKVKVHDFVDSQLGRANPYGVYDIGRNEGWVGVGTDHDTASFAVETIRRWWRAMGSKTYPAAKELMITTDGGGSNGSRVRLWKVELQRLANELGIPITVCHLPPGTSKWNKIEHRMFSYISMNWRGQPLVSHEVIVNLIAATKTSTGLRVKAELDTDQYPAGIKITDEEFARVLIVRNEFHGEWNYKISPNIN
ncbi:MAG: ISAzo13 family transposase [Nitrospirae bacterium]|nr:ISAzo13 family transposase [Nitrospirota bacterium]